MKRDYIRDYMTFATVINEKDINSLYVYQRRSLHHVYLPIKGDIMSHVVSSDVYFYELRQTFIPLAVVDKDGVLHSLIYSLERDSNEPPKLFRHYKFSKRKYQFGLARITDDGLSINAVTDDGRIFTRLYPIHNPSDLPTDMKENADDDYMKFGDSVRLICTTLSREVLVSGDTRNKGCVCIDGIEVFDVEGSKWTELHITPASAHIETMSFGDDIVDNVGVLAADNGIFFIEFEEAEDLDDSFRDEGRYLLSDIWFEYPDGEEISNISKIIAFGESQETNAEKGVLLLTKDGKVYAIGTNPNRVLGTEEEYIDEWTLVKENVKDMKLVGGAEESVLYIMQNGEVRCSGSNNREVPNHSLNLWLPIGKSDEMITNAKVKVGRVDSYIGTGYVENRLKRSYFIKKDGTLVVGEAYAEPEHDTAYEWVGDVVRMEKAIALSCIKTDVITKNLC